MSAVDPPNDRRPMAPVADLAVLEPGSHLCGLYADDAQLGRMAAAFVGTGLAAGDQVLYVAGDRAPDAVRAGLEASGVGTGESVDSGQLVLRRFDDIYGRSGGVNLAEIATGFRATAARCRSDGFPGLRVAAEMSGFAQVAGSMEQLLRWERMASRLQQEEAIRTVCQYDRRRLSGAEAALVAAEHTALAPDAAAPPLASFFATATPWGLRVVGELDLANRTALLRALRARLADRSRLWLDVEGVSFADVGTLAEVYQAGAGIPAGGRITIVNAPPHLMQLIELAELHHPQVAIEP